MPGSVRKGKNTGQIYGEFVYQTDRFTCTVFVAMNREGLPEAKAVILDKTGRVR
jgi:hypothetical protein